MNRARGGSPGRRCRVAHLVGSRAGRAGDLRAPDRAFAELNQSAPGHRGSQRASRSAARAPRGAAAVSAAGPRSVPLWPSPRIAASGAEPAASPAVAPPEPALPCSWRRANPSDGAVTRTAIFAEGEDVRLLKEGTRSAASLSATSQRRAPSSSIRSPTAASHRSQVAVRRTCTVSLVPRTVSDMMCRSFPRG